jgi:hypothetical protein
VLVQVLVDPRAGDRALVHPDVEAVAARDLAEHPHRGLGERADLGDLLGVAWSYVAMWRYGHTSM